MNIIEFFCVKIEKLVFVWNLKCKKNLEEWMVRLR